MYHLLNQKYSLWSAMVMRPENSKKHRSSPVIREERRFLLRTFRLYKKPEKRKRQQPDWTVWLPPQNVERI